MEKIINKDEYSEYSNGVYVYMKEGSPGLKIGGATGNICERISEQHTTSNYKPFKILEVFPITEQNKNKIQNLSSEDSYGGNELCFKLEHAIHKKLSPYRINVSREWFECSLSDISCAYNEIINGVSRKNNFKMRPEQEDAVDQAYNYFVDEDTFLFDAIMRFGKTFTTYQLMKKLDAKKVLILTYKPAIKEEWKNELLDHINFPEYFFVDGLKLNDKEQQEKLKNEKVVIFSSFQDILGTKINGQPKEKFEKLLQIDFDFVIVDEVHYGFGNIRPQEFLGKLNYKKRLDLSGTPIHLKTSGYYEDEQIYSWSYIDEQRKKQTGNSIYRWLPRINLYTFKVSDEVWENVKYFSDDEYLTMNKFFGVKNDKFINRSSVDKFLNNLASTEPRRMKSPFNINIDNKYLKHTFWYMSGVKEITSMKKVLNDHNYFKDYEIIIAAGKNDGLGKDTLGNVKRAISGVGNQIGKYKGKIGTITLSCGKLNTGVSIPEWGSVFFLSDVESVQDYWQTAFRVKTSNKKAGKKECYIFDFNPQRALKMTYDYAMETTKKGNSIKNGLSEFLDCMSVLSYSGGQLIEKSTEGILKEIVSIGTNAKRNIRRFGSDWMSSLKFNLEDDVLDILKKSNGGKNGALGDVEISDSGTKKGKNKKKTDGGGGETPVRDKKEIKNILDAVRGFTMNLPTFLFLADDEYLNWQELGGTEEIKIFELIIGIEPEEFGKILESGLINKDRLNKALESFYSTMPNFDNMGILECLKEMRSLLGYLNPTSNQEIMTPWKLINEILDKLPKDVWDLEKTFCDPAVKSGIFLVEIVIRLMEEYKGNKSENDIYKYITKECLYGYTTSKQAELLTKKCLPGFVNMDSKINILERKLEDMPKFDVVIGNPPYNTPRGKNKNMKTGKLYDKFMNLGLDITNNISCMVVPQSWLFNQGSMVNFRNHLIKNGLREVYTNKQSFFDSVNISAGVCYYITNVNVNKNLYINGNLSIGNDYNIITIDSEVINILDKMSKSPKMSELYKNPQNIKSNIFKDLSDSEFKNSIPVEGPGLNKKLKHIDKNKVTLSRYDLDKWKCGFTRGGTASEITIGSIKKNITRYLVSLKLINPLNITTMSISYFPFDTETEAINCKQYLTTKFSTLLRYLAQDSYTFPSLAFKYVPHMDFTRSWTDEDLYTHFKLTEEEINYIETYDNK